MVDQMWHKRAKGADVREEVAILGASYNGTASTIDLRRLLFQDFLAAVIDTTVHKRP